MKKTRFRFDRFVVSPARRAVLCDGREVPLIPRYFDLLTLLIERRGEALARRDILDAVWSDVVVSDGALSQAVRTLRRVLADDPKQPRYIRTVPRHGYRFVFTDVFEEPDDVDAPGVAASSVAAEPGADADVAFDPFATDLERVLRAATTPDEEDERRDAAERLHAIDTAEALRRIDRRPGHAAARALLRDARWEVATAGPVPILGQPGAWLTALVLVRLRLQRVLRLAGKRWLSAIAGAGGAGLVAGGLGAIALFAGPGSTATHAVFVALPLVGLAAAALGAAGVAGGLSIAEVLFRSRRRLALVVCGAAGGGVVGAAVHLVGRWMLEGLFGARLEPLAGGVEGLVIGGAVGLGYGLATPTVEGGMATPHGAARLRAGLGAGLVCGAATALLAWSGSHLGAMSLDLVARVFPGSQVGLDPLARLLGEPAPGVVTRIVISAWEGSMFGSGLVLGLTRRPRS